MVRIDQENRELKIKLKSFKQTRKTIGMASNGSPEDSMLASANPSANMSLNLGEFS